jgi:O-antigen ligase/polysaccharide polymerase Wzy-like membrane protein
MTSATGSAVAARASAAGRAFASGTAVAAVAVVVGVVVAASVVRGQWYLAAGALCAAPAFVYLQRSPLVAVKAWLVLAPLVTVTDSGAMRKLFWLVHRGLPIATLLVVLMGAIAGTSPRRFPRLGLPELMMGGYVVLTLLSIAYTTTEGLGNFYTLYDNVVAPMAIYLVVRLLEPDDDDIRSLVPYVVFMLVTQSLIGLTSWVAPAVLPSAWLGKVGERTVGSLRATAVFTTVIVFCGMFLLCVGMSAGRRFEQRLWAILWFVLAVVMVFMTFSRAGWIAGCVAVAGILVYYRRFLPNIALVVAPVALVLLGSGVLASQLTFADERLHSQQSQESALSRLPVVFAAFRMFEEKPALGWGYENFDRYDYQFQKTVGNLVAPEKDHASHNLFLTTLAEQGVVGLVLFVGPMCCWFLRTTARRRRLPRRLLGRDLVVAMWLVVAAFVIVNNFERMQVPVGFGIWWLTLGLIATVVDRARPGVDAAAADR